MRVRTGKGDSGLTDLPFRSQRVSKDNEYINAIGELDEFNSYLGLVKSKIKTRIDKEIIDRIQRAVFVISSEIALGVPQKKSLGTFLRVEDVDWIKGVEYTLEKKVNLESGFYIPGGGEIPSLIDISRTLSRKAERTIVGLFRKNRIKNDKIIPFINCVSDVLFLLARKSATGNLSKIKVGRK